MINCIDLFAGLGGNTEAARLAGQRVLWAANHWPLAVDLHAKNHPEVIHSCQDLKQADWSEIPNHDLVMASPECKGHTKARGKEKGRHGSSRSTAWAVVDCLEHHKSEVAIVENVVEFMKWQLYPSWCDALNRLGYTVSTNIIDAADLGVPQNRVRVFIVLTRSQNKFKFKLNKLEHKPAWDCIEWDKHKWSKILKPGRSKKTISKIVRARNEGLGKVFTIPYYGKGSGETGRSLQRPLGTITTKDRWAIVNGNRMRMFQPSELRKIMAFRNNYVLPDNKADATLMLGNAVSPPVMCELINQLKQCA